MNASWDPSGLTCAVRLGRAAFQYSVAAIDPEPVVARHQHPDEARRPFIPGVEVELSRFGFFAVVVLFGSVRSEVATK